MTTQIFQTAFGPIHLKKNADHFVASALGRTITAVSPEIDHALRQTLEVLTTEKINETICRIRDDFMGVRGGKPKTLRAMRNKWDWLAKDPGKAEYVYITSHSGTPLWSNLCPCCDYIREKTRGQFFLPEKDVCQQHCPMEWEGSPTCSEQGSIYLRWRDNFNPHEKSYYAMCMRDIANRSLYKCEVE